MKASFKSSLLTAAVAGLLGASMSAPSIAEDKGTSKKKAAKQEMEKCYGINKCGGHGKCGGKGHSCAGTNSCAGQGWLEVPKGLCMEIKDGSLTPPEAKKEKAK